MFTGSSLGVDGERCAADAVDAPGFTAFPDLL
jgi:hypothetical protein